MGKAEWEKRIDEKCKQAHDDIDNNRGRGTAFVHYTGDDVYRLHGRRGPERAQVTL